MMRSRKTSDMGHLGTRNQCKTGTRWQLKQLLEPGTAHFFDHRYGWATGIPCRILIPGSREPVGGKGGRKGTTNDPPKKATTRATEYPTCRISYKLVNDLGCLHPDIRKLPPKPLAQSSKRGRRGNRGMLKVLKIRERVGQGLFQNLP